MSDAIDQAFEDVNDGRGLEFAMERCTKPLVDMLEKHQWYPGALDCPECLCDMHRGHEPDCALAKLLEHHGRTVKWKT